MYIYFFFFIIMRWEESVFNYTKLQVSYQEIFSYSDITAGGGFLWDKGEGANKQYNWNDFHASDKYRNKINEGITLFDDMIGGNCPIHNNTTIAVKETAWNEFSETRMNYHWCSLVYGALCQTLLTTTVRDTLVYPELGCKVDHSHALELIAGASHTNENYQ